MSRKVIDYKMLADNMSGRFTDEVKSLMADGWKLHGKTKISNLTSSDGFYDVFYSQAMIKYENPEDVVRCQIEEICKGAI